MVGLTHQEALRRLQQYGPNEAVLERRKSLVGRFLDCFKSPLILLLLGASAISAYFGEVASSLIIVVIVIVSSALDFINSFKSDRAAQKLTDRVKINATTLRDGQPAEVPVSRIVPGDVVMLKAGAIIPADGQLIEAKHCYTNESSLTGESFPQSKKGGDVLYMGSSVISGEGLLKVTATGKHTKFSHITAALSQQNQATEFDREMSAFSVLILKITFVLVVFVFFVNTLLKGNILESLLFSVALAVGITPELLPMIMTLNLTKGSLTMAKRGVIVKRLAAIQNFGSMSLLCTDKTGTLTEDKIVLVRYINSDGHTCEEVLKYAYLNSALTGGFHNPLDEAIKEFKTLPVGTFHKLDELPFDFERRRESIIAKHQGEVVLITKGAPEDVLKVCTHFRRDHTAHRLTEARHEQLRQLHQQLSQEGFRVLGLAISALDPHQTHYETRLERDMTFLGFVAFLDPPKKSVADTLAKMHQFGVGVKIITGDNELTSQRVASELNFPITGVLLGSQLERMGDHQLRLKAEEVNLFARVNPEQKLRIIRILQTSGHVVGYLGDGINDAPSLKAADVGISVNNAVDVAKESADLILLHKSLEDLIQGIVEGRKTFANTMKYLMMVLSSNFGNVFSMAGASLLLPFLPMLPAQILLNNLLYDTSQFTIPTDAVDERDVMQPQKMHLSSIKRFMYLFGPLSSVFDFITFAVLFWVFGFRGAPFQTGWFLESLATQIFVVYIIRTRRLPFIHSRPSWALIGSTALMVLVGWVVAENGWGGVVGFAPLPVGALISIGAITVSYLFVIEVAKRLFYWWEGKSTVNQSRDHIGLSQSKPTMA